MATFIGEYTCKVDTKGRIILPMAFKKHMPADEPDRFVVQKDIFVKCLILYSWDEWKLELDKLRKWLNPYNPEHNMFRRIFFKRTAELSLDNNNRLLVPKKLLDFIGAQRDVVLTGQDGRIELWAADVYDTIDMDPARYSDQAKKLLGGGLNEPEL